MSEEMEKNYEDICNWFVNLRLVDCICVEQDESDELKKCIKFNFGTHTVTSTQNEDLTKKIINDIITKYSFFKNVDNDDNNYYINMKRLHYSDVIKNVDKSYSIKYTFKDHILKWGPYTSWHHAYGYMKTIFYKNFEYDSDDYWDDSSDSD